MKLIVLLIFTILLSSCSSKRETGKLVNINYIDIVRVEDRISISYYRENPLREDEEKEPRLKWELRCFEGRPFIALWVWDVKRLKGNLEKFREFVRENDVRRIYLQVSRSLDKSFISTLKKSGLEVFLLDGGKDMKLNFPPEFITSLDPDGFQLDIEPYLNKDFNLRKEKYLKAYVKFLRDVRKKLKRLKLSVVVPFWYDKLHVGRRPLLYYVFKYADEVVVMAYRNNLKEALHLSREEIELSKRFKKDILIGLEFHPLKDEHHHVYRVDRDGLTFVGKYVVRGKRLTFPKEKVDLLRRLKCRGVKGFVIHSFEAF